MDPPTHLSALRCVSVDPMCKTVEEEAFMPSHSFNERICLVHQAVHTTCFCAAGAAKAAMRREEPGPAEDVRAPHLAAVNEVLWKRAAECEQSNTALQWQADEAGLLSTVDRLDSRTARARSKVLEQRLHDAEERLGRLSGASDRCRVLEQRCRQLDQARDDALQLVAELRSRLSGETERVHHMVERLEGSPEVRAAAAHQPVPVPPACPHLMPTGRSPVRCAGADRGLGRARRLQRADPRARHRARRISRAPRAGGG